MTPPPPPKPWEFRPARDLDLPLVARLRSQRREQGLTGVAGHALWLGAVRAYLRLAHRVTVVGADNIPKQAPFVMVGNHTSHLDALSLAAALPRGLAHRTVTLAAGDTFFDTVAGAAFAAAALNALPIWRKETSAADLALLRERLSEDRMVFILFPEGTRSRDGVMGRFRPGLGAFVAGTAVPVLPCFLHGAHACWPPGQSWPRPGRLTLRIGPPLRFDALANDRDGWREVARQAEQAVRALAS